VAKEPGKPVVFEAKAPFGEMGSPRWPRPMAAASRRVLILGAGGQLGRVVGEAFGKRKWVTLGVDAFLAPSTDKVLTVNASATPEDQLAMLLPQIREALGPDKLDAVVNVAGGFAMGSAAHGDMVERTRDMLESSVYTSLIAAHVASEVLRPGGLIVLPGAEAALGPTAWSLPYGSAKAAVHHLVRSLADTETSGLGEGVKTVGLAPVTLDTPQNRHSMPDADFTTWASLEEVADGIERMCAAPAGVENGMVYVVAKESGKPAVFDAKVPL